MSQAEKSNKLIFIEFNSSQSGLMRIAIGEFFLGQVGKSRLHSQGRTSGKMNGWKTVGMVIEGQPLVIGGLNVWDHDWKRLLEPSLHLPHPGYPSELHSMSVYEITDRGECVRFAAGELSANVWGFYVPD